ncbi:MAG TPA: PDZ domain-containing protein [Vicinamibacterales bacterium]|jgi:tricorn protease
MRRIFLLLALSIGVASHAAAQVDARMFRYPAVSADKIAFVYAGDIWLVPKAGGTAVRLSSPAGEESFPRFSPDGTKIAYTADYDGNADVYVIPTIGGTPTRLTYHPMADRVIGWHPDGKRVLFASARESGRQRYNQFYLVGLDGGLPEKLPVPYGEFGAYSPDGSRFVYMPMSQDFRNWKRYRGGWSPDLWIFDLTSMAARNITNNPANDAQPMWRGNTIYFLSDRDASERNNIWAEDVNTGAVREITHFVDFDITFPSLGGDSIVFLAGGRLHLLNLTTEKDVEVPIRVVSDETTLRAHAAKADKLAGNPSVSPTGKRVAFEARGDVVTVPAERGAVIDVTRSSGVADRYPRWSPDGKTLAYWSDRSGEYELTLMPAESPGTERKVTSLGAGFRYPPQWAPDSKKIVFIDQAMRIHVYDDATGKVSDVDKSPDWIAHGGLEVFRFQWSPDSRWFAYSRPASTGNSAIFLFDTKNGKVQQVTSGYLNDTEPTFDPEGKYLYYASDRTFDPVYGTFDNSWTYANSTQIVVVPLRKDVKSPLAARNDAEMPAIDTDKKSDTKPDEKADKTPDKSSAPANVDIDLEGFEARGVVLPPKAGTYADLTAVKGKVVYRRQPPAGTHGEKSPVLYFDLDAREEKTILDNADGIEVTFDGKKLLASNDHKYAVVDVKEKQSFDKPLSLSDIEVPVNPRAEWKQIFLDTYRFERDFFYDPGMHGVNWNGMKERYMTLLDDAVSRWDVNWVIGEFLGELNSSHTYHGGGDEQQGEKVSVGMLGVDWELANNAYRIKHIVRGGPWDSERSPLDRPGVNIKEGEYVLAVNGVPIDAKRDPYASFQALGRKTVVLTVNSTPSMTNAREEVVTCLDDEIELRFKAWIEERRQIVDKATNGRVGYLYVQSTGTDAQNDLMRQFMAQYKKDGLIIDERWNSGGQIPDRFIELLHRPVVSYWAVRDAPPQQWPPVAHRGAEVMLINGWSGSGGDAFPFYFRQAGLGPLIGTRTWGGLIGISGAPDLTDGGNITVPTFRMFDTKGQWFAEGHGVDPDIQVEEDPTQLAKGNDTQLQRAIQEITTRVNAEPKAPARPAYEKRVPKG